MDSKYDIKPRNGFTKFNGFGKAHKTPLILQKKSLKNKLNQQVKNGGLANGKTQLLNSPLVQAVQKAALLDEGQKKSLVQQRKLLPVYKFRNRIVSEILNNDCLVLLGETGSGKTTQIPQFVYECGRILKDGVCAVTQPRRMAAISIAQRVAEEQAGKVGDLVG